MKIERMNKMLAMALAVAMTVSTFAQAGPPQGRGQGGPPPGMGQRGPGMMPGFRMGPAPFLMQEKVQRELKLTDEQIEKLENLRPPMGGPEAGPRGQGQMRGQGQGQMRGQGGPPQGRPPMGGPGGPGGPNREAMEAPIKEILNANQFKRYQELSLQWEGPIAIGREDVAEKIGLTGEKLEEVRQLIGESMGRPGGPGGPGGPPDQMRGQGQGRGQGQQGRGQGQGQGQGRGQGQPPVRGQGQGGPGFGDPGQMMARREEVGKKVLALLTNEQKRKWEGLLGRKFEFEAPR
ncbi:MAG: hypothetical protein K8H99_06375 [Nitrospirae bacterium]|nr:hypothetical protein [Fimbriimonadaceae bacterium]